MDRQKIRELTDTMYPEVVRIRRHFHENAEVSEHEYETCQFILDYLTEQNIEFSVKPAVCDGIEACKTALLKKSKNVLDANFIEGMACTGGCIGGAGCLTHGEKNKAEVDKYGKEAFEKTISDAVSILK